jgi:hypothetical protein
VHHGLQLQRNNGFTRPTQLDSMMKRAVMVVGLAWSMVGCGIAAQLPPPEAPDQVMPPVSANAAPGAGDGQATLDADEPSSVDEYAGDTSYIDGDGNEQSSPTYTPVCAATPCVANLVPGPHQLRFTSNADDNHFGIGTVTVGAQPTDYRFALGHNDLNPHFTRGLFTTVGGATAALGGIFMYAFTQQPGSPSPSSSVGTAGLITALVGAAITVLGVHWLGDPGHAQDGTGVQWTP